MSYGRVGSGGIFNREQDRFVTGYPHLLLNDQKMGNPSNVNFRGLRNQVNEHREQDTANIDIRPGVQVVTLISDAEAYDGAQAMVRAGSSPYQFVNLTYDSTYGKWVSPPVKVFSQERKDIQWTNVYGSVQHQHHGGFIGFDCDAIYDDGGLRPQFMGGYTISYSVAAPQVSAVGFELFESNHNDTGVPPHSSISSTFMYGEANNHLTWHEKQFDWVQVTPTGTTDNGWTIRLMTKVTSAGTGYLWGAGVFMRWVSA